MVMLSEHLRLSFNFWRIKFLSKRCLYLIYQGPLQAWSYGVILPQIFYVQILERTFWWFNLLVCSTNLHICSDIRDRLSKLQFSNKLLLLDLEGFSQARPDSHFPLSPDFQELLESKWLGLFQRDRFSYLMLLLPRKKKKKKELLSSPRRLNPVQTEVLCLSL